MGEVYLALHEQLGRRVAIKVLQEKALLEPEMRSRFQREAMAAARLASDHIAQVSDVGELENGAPFMVMEYLQGQDLSAYLQQRGVLPVGEVLDLLWQLCTGISVAHAAGIIHRDLKPANLFLLPRQGGGHLLKILDFGIAKTIGLQASLQTVVPTSARSSAAPTQLTNTATLLGSAKYMAPEQMESAKDVDARADLWSIGVIAYKLLTGKNAFDGSSLEELFIAMSTRPPAPLAQLRPDTPPALIMAIERCLQPVRDQRWPSVAAFQAAIGDAFSRPAPSPPPAAPAPGANPTVLKIVVGLLVGVIIAGFGLVASCIVLGVLSSRSYAPTKLPISDARHVEPVDLLPVIKSRAKVFDGAASLWFISVTGAQNGSVDLDAAGTISYNYVTPKGASRALLLVVTDQGLSTAESNPGQFGLSPEPRCRYAQAWKAAVTAGIPANCPDATYGLVSPNNWNFYVKALSKTVEIDGQTCAVVHK